MSSYIVWFVGDTDNEERVVVDFLASTYCLRQFEEPRQVYQHLAQNVPHILMFSKQVMGTQALKLFRQLRHVEQVCVMVCQNTDIYAFAGKGHEHRSSAPNTQNGVQSLLDWSKRMSSHEISYPHPSTILLPPWNHNRSVPIRKSVDQTQQPDIQSPYRRPLSQPTRFWGGLMMMFK